MGEDGVPPSAPHPKHGAFPTSCFVLLFNNKHWQQQWPPASATCDCMQCAVAQRKRQIRASRFWPPFVTHAVVWSVFVGQTLCILTCITVGNPSKGALLAVACSHQDSLVPGV